MDLRGAKSNVTSLFRAFRNRNCPLVALLGHGHLSRLHAGNNVAIVGTGEDLGTVLPQTPSNRTASLPNLDRCYYCTVIVAPVKKFVPRFDHAFTTME
jgi:hypothetical protein